LIALLVILIKIRFGDEGCGGQVWGLNIVNEVIVRFRLIDHVLSSEGDCPSDRVTNPYKRSKGMVVGTFNLGDLKFFAKNSI
jgi:hypothetical protein